MRGSVGPRLVALEVDSRIRTAGGASVRVLVVGSRVVGRIRLSIGPLIGHVAASAVQVGWDGHVEERTEANADRRSLGRRKNVDGEIKADTVGKPAPLVEMSSEANLPL